MHPVLEKTIGGLSPSYYFRQFVFGLVISALLFFAATRAPNPVPLAMIVFVVVNTILYPYSRFVYEGIVGFIMGDNVFYGNAFLMLFVKLLTMALCWSFAIFVAPVGLLYLYFHHTKAERNRQ